MEHFEAMGVGATEGSKAKLQNADLYVGIIAHRYGYIEGGYNKSVTELEYDYAGELGLKRLCFVIDPTYAWPEYGRDPENYTLLNAFKSKIDKVIRLQFTSVDDFTAKLTAIFVAVLDRHLITSQSEVPLGKSIPIKQYTNAFKSKFWIFGLTIILIGILYLLLRPLQPIKNEWRFQHRSRGLYRSTIEH